jgi:L-threonylcarbamoyladenylate synthase
LIEMYQKEWKKVWIIGSKEREAEYLSADKIFILWSQNNLPEISQKLFATLRQIDSHHLDIVFCETFETKGIGLAIMDRLKRACEK